MELKPCPFCGGSDLVEIEAVGEFWVECQTCKASVQNVSSGAEYARKLWNTRAPTPSAPIKGE